MAVFTSFVKDRQAGTQLATVLSTQAQKLHNNLLVDSNSDFDNTYICYLSQCMNTCYRHVYSSTTYIAVPMTMLLGARLYMYNSKL